MAKILVVDDRLTNRQYLLTLLGFYGHELFEASNGAEALDTVRAARPDLVITDVLMPTMDGYQLARALRQDRAGPQPRLMFYTAVYSAPMAQEVAEECGVDAVLTKPSDPGDIVAAVNRVLGVAEPSARPLPEPVTPGAPALPADYNLAKYITRLQVTKRSFDEMIERSVSAVLERELAEMVSEEFATDIADLRRLLFRLTVLIEVSTETTAERDPARIVEIFFGAACEIIGSRYAAIAIVGEKDRRLMHLYAKDLPMAPLQTNPMHGVLGALACGQRSLRWDANQSRANAAGLPPGHPACCSFLGVAISARGIHYGWLYFANKEGADTFSDEDERFAAILVEKLALLYENALFYDLVQRHAAQLQVESSQRAAAEARLRESEQRFRQMAENMRDVFFLDSMSGEVLYVNPAYEEIWGRSRESLYADPRSWCEAIHEDDREATMAKFDSALKTTGEFEMEFRIRRPDGTLRWVRARGFPARNEAGAVYRIAGVAEDITERKEHEEKIARLSRIREVLSGINSAIVRIRERDGLLNEACRIAVDLGGFALASIAMRDPGDTLTTVTTYGTDAERFARMRSHPDEHSGVSGKALATGRVAWCNDLTRTEAHSPMCTEMLRHGYRAVIALPLLFDGKVVGLLELCSREPGVFDEDELKLLEELAGDVSFALEFIAKTERLDYLAYYDAMTNLPNGTLYLDRLAQLITLAGETTKVAVIVFDLDRFTDINDRLGRHAGDELLKAVARRLGETVAQPCTLARVGANMFAAAVGGLRHSADAVTALRERVQVPLAQPFELADERVHLTARAGIAVFPDDGADASLLYRHAEAALKQVKGAGRFLYYSAQANARISARLALEQQLNEAVRERQFVLYYQPRVELFSGAIVGAEALIRWEHPERGLLEPDAFIPVAEETGIVEPIGDWVIDAVCAQQSAWLNQYGLTVPVALNLSAVQIGKQDFIDCLQRSITGRQLDRKYLEVELTESAMMENLDEAMRTLSALRALGISLSLDDFGTGYSSLAYLKRFPFNFVKIDKSFIADIVHNPEDAIIARAIIALAHRLNLRVVAEGVETEAQLSYLRTNGCDEIQGYYFSRPVPSHVFGEMLRSGKRLDLPVIQIPGDARTVLVADSTEETLASLRQVLQTEGREVLTAITGERALDVLSVNPVQVLVCEQRMPGMSGTQLCSRVQALYPEIVRIVLTDYVDIEAVIDAMNRGVVYRFLTRPWDDRLLRAHVRDALRHYAGVTRNEVFSE